MLNLCVVFGGASTEYEVSLRSATSVLNNLDRKRYHIIMVGITKQGQWLYYNGPVELIADGRWEHSPYTCPAILSPDPGQKGLFLQEQSLPSSVMLRRRLAGLDETERDNSIIPIDVVFPVLHGKNGEDGTIQGLLALAKLPCVGCGVLASAACMDKEVTHVLLEKAGIEKTKLLAVHPQDMKNFDAVLVRLEARLGFPMFIKPANAGSSVGISKVERRDQIKPALDLAFRHDKKVVVEQAVAGQEIECAVMGNSVPVAADVLGEIAPKSGFYDYKGKYLNDSVALHVPARIDEETAKKVKDIALRAYQVMGCTGLARVDFFVTPEGKPVLNEINTMPGFTSISMYPRLFEAGGIPYAQLLDRLIDYALEQ